MTSDFRQKERKKGTKEQEKDSALKKERKHHYSIGVCVRQQCTEENTKQGYPHRKKEQTEKPKQKQSWMPSNVVHREQ